MPEKETIELKLTTVQRLQLKVYLENPQFGVDWYPRLYARELRERIEFSSEEAYEANLRDEALDPKNPQSLVIPKWDKEMPIELELEDKQRAALLQILLRVPPNQISKAGEDIVFQLIKSPEELEELLGGIRGNRK